jgi:hypothetical protein
MYIMIWLLILVCVILGGGYYYYTNHYLGQPGKWTDEQKSHYLKNIKKTIMNNPNYINTCPIDEMANKVMIYHSNNKIFPGYGDYNVNVGSSVENATNIHNIYYPKCFKDYN